MTQDFRYAFRVLAKAPLLTAALVVSLGIGIGANAAVFNFISALLLRPPAGIDHAATLAIVRATRSSAGDAGLASFADVQELRTSRAFEAISAYDDSLVTGITFLGETRRARVASVTSDLFTTLGMDASQGRMLTPADHRGVVISHRLWEIGRRAGNAIGSPLVIDRVEYAVAGIAPEGFRGFHPGRMIDVWRLAPDPQSDADRTSRTLHVLARTPDRDRSEQILGGRFRVLRYSFLEPDRAAETALLGAILSGATLLVLICACVNAASLLLSRGNARRPDLAVKLALGASRASLIGQLLLESALVGLAGGLAGLLFAHWTMTIVPSLFAPEHAEMLDAGLRTGLVVTTMVGAVVVSMALGLLPALRGTRPVMSLDLRGDAGNISKASGASRLQMSLVVSQIALSTVLLIAAMLMNRSVSQALEGDLGETTRNVAVATISEPPFRFDPFTGLRSFAQIVDQVRRRHDVVDAGLTSTLPLGIPNARVFRIEAAPGVMEQIEADTSVVSPTYFGAMDTPLVEGRVFTAADTFRAPAVAIVNDAAVQRYFNGSALGRHLIDERGDAIEIVGIVASGRYRTLQADPAPMVYRPLAQDYVPRMYLMARLKAEVTPERFTRLRPALLAPGLQLRRMSSLEEHFAEAMVLDRFIATLVSACGLMALLLAIAGSYSLMLDSVQRRTREIGLRIALGASAMRIGQSVFGFGLALTGAGVAAGMVLMLAVERAARMFVFGLPAIDLASLAIAAGILLIVVSLAAILPARRALGVSPTVALRS